MVKGAIMHVISKDGLIFAVTATLGVVLWVSCSDSSITPPGVDRTLAASILQADESLDRQLGGIELRFKEIEDSVPGFAGFYFDRETRGLVMRLTDLGRQGQLQPHAEREADERLRGDGSRRGVRYESAEYSFSDLRGFRGAMFRHLQREDVVFVDIDEVQNRLVIGVTSEAAIRELLSIASRSGIPEGGIHIARTVRNSVDRGTAEMYKLTDHWAGTLRDCYEITDYVHRGRLG